MYTCARELVAFRRLETEAKEVEGSFKKGEKTKC